MRLDRFIRTYQESEVVFQENSRGREMYFVHAGKVSLYKQQTAGQNILLATLETGCLFGEMALVNDSPRSATAIAMEPNTELIVVSKSQFLTLLRGRPEFALVIIQTLADRLREADVARAELEKTLASREGT